MSDYQIHFLKSENYIQTVEVDQEKFEQLGLEGKMGEEESYFNFRSGFDPLEHPDLGIDGYSILEAAYEENPRLLTSAITDEKLEDIYDNIDDKVEDLNPKDIFEVAETFDTVVASNIEKSELGELDRGDFLERVHVVYERS
ncbi:MAG: hypothetical protein H8Z69_01655 [Nanohaloarchaea archaeon]|nr:hypothetical protein [Candidatus Nanohaloarchaea archaeon]